MNQSQQAFIQFLIHSGALRFGDFQLKSGDHSPFFINLGDLSTGSQLATLGDFLAVAVDLHFPYADILFGPAYKGIPMVTATAGALWQNHGREVSICYNRKEIKDHGEGGSLIGAGPHPGNRIVVIDDVLSSGGTKLETVELVRRVFGVSPDGILVTVDRTRKSCPLDKAALGLHSMVALPDLLDYLAAQQDPQFDALRSFYHGEHV